MYSEPEPEAHAIEATLILKVHATASLDCLLTNCLKVVNKPSSREAILSFFNTYNFAIREQTGSAMMQHRSLVPR